VICLVSVLMVTVQRMKLVVLNCGKEAGLTKVAKFRKIMSDDYNVHSICRPALGPTQPPVEGKEAGV